MYAAVVTRALALTVLVSTLFACTDRKAEEEIDREPICEAYCENQHACFEPGSELAPLDCYDSCLVEQGWENCEEETMAEYFECLAGLTCEQYEDQLGVPEGAPCTELILEFSRCAQ